VQDLTTTSLIAEVKRWAAHTNWPLVPWLTFCAGSRPGDPTARTQVRCRSEFVQSQDDLRPRQAPRIPQAKPKTSWLTFASMPASRCSETSAWQTERALARCLLPDAMYGKSPRARARGRHRARGRQLARIRSRRLHIYPLGRRPPHEDWAATFRARVIPAHRRWTLAPRMGGSACHALVSEIATLA